MMTTLKMSGFSDEEALNLIEENWKYSQHLTLTRDKLRFIYANL